jgi:hypothetical protein
MVQRNVTGGCGSLPRANARAATSIAAAPLRLSHEQSPGGPIGAGELDDEVARITAAVAAAVGGILADGSSRYSRLPQPLANEPHDLALTAAGAGNGHHGHDEIGGRAEIGLGRLCHSCHVIP